MEKVSAGRCARSEIQNSRPRRRNGPARCSGALYLRAASSWVVCVRFARDSSLEGDGFELSVPGCETAIGQPSWGAELVSNEPCVCRSKRCGDAQRTAVAFGPAARVGHPLVGQCGEPTHVGEPDHRVDRFGVAAMDPATENALAGEVADISVEKIARGAPQGAHRPGRRAAVVQAIGRIT